MSAAEPVAWQPVETESEAIRVARIALEEADRVWGRAALEEEVARRRALAAGKALDLACKEAQRARARTENARDQLAALLSVTP